MFFRDTQQKKTAKQHFLIFLFFFFFLFSSSPFSIVAKELEKYLRKSIFLFKTILIIHKYRYYSTIKRILDRNLDLRSIGRNKNWNIKFFNFSSRGIIQFGRLVCLVRFQLLRHKYALRVS